MDGRREDIPDPRRSEARRSESDMMGEHSVELYTRVCGVDQYKPGDLIVPDHCGSNAAYNMKN